ncbi:IL9 protein, partial [Alcedo cyanopectus]|nr:IL9 protein [Ceyx cyanopectus]
MNASMLSFILFSCLLLSVQAKNCYFSEIIRYTNRLLNEGSASCPCRDAAVNSCSCLPIAEPGHELACFVEGTAHMLNANMSSHTMVELLNRSFRMQLDRKLCQSLARDNKCLYNTKGNVEEFLKKILSAYQTINK